MSRLQRFRDAQEQSSSGFDTALAEIQAGSKQGHWIWYIFPQLSGLGTSHFSQVYGLADAGEADEYLHDRVLRERLLIVTKAVAEQLRRGVSVSDLMGSDIDARKLVSSLTLFEHFARSPHADHSDDYRDLAQAAEEILAVAESGGYPRCRFTLDRLRASQRQASR
jgi:uncharacterized protein (DUF1810 family)